MVGQAGVARWTRRIDRRGAITVPVTTYTDCKSMLQQSWYPYIGILTGWFRLNAKNCVPGNSSRRFFELGHEILHTYSGRQYLKLEEGGFLIWGFAVEISGF